jgi:hypothetical protein
MNRFRAWWRSHVRRWWSDYRWPILLALGLVALLLGLIGFTKNGLATGEGRTFLDNLYLTLGLLSMNSGSVPSPVSWELQVARFTVPALAAYTALLALAMVFTQQSQQVRLWFMRDHVIICGLGRKGVRLANQFRERGDKVVVIEADEGNDWIEASRSSGAIVLNGDACDPEILRKARLNHARYLISVVGDDGKNAEVAVLAEKLSHEREDGALTCSIHIVDPQLWYLLREKELDIAADSHFRLELFNIFDRGASLLLKTHSPWAGDQGEQICDKHLVLIGMGKLGQSLVIQAASQWREQRVNADQRLRFTIVDLDARQKKETLCVRYPNLEEVSELEPLQMDVRSADFQRGGFLYDEGGNCDVDSVYVCMDNDSLGLHTGLTLYQKIRDHNIPVIVRMVEDAGLALLLQEGDKNKSLNKKLHAFPLLDQTCTPDLILRGTHEVLARDLHEAYLKGLDSEQVEGGGDLALDTWEDLPEDTKERNRKQADRIGVILEEHGYRIAPLTDWKAADLVFSEKDGSDEVEAMARMEHEMWCQEMLANDWQHGPVRSKKQKTNPDIGPWEKLSPEEINKNKKFIHDLPKVLARAGFQIERQFSKRI